jgi:hypothetical protein
MFHIFFNKKTNQGIAMPHLPDIQYYNPDSMTTDPTRASNRKSFIEWYVFIFLWSITMSWNDPDHLRF